MRAIRNTDMFSSKHQPCMAATCLLISVMAACPATAALPEVPLRLLVQDTAGPGDAGLAGSNMSGLKAEDNDSHNYNHHNVFVHAILMLLGWVVLLPGEC